MHTKAASFSQIMGLILVIFLSTGWILYQAAANLEARADHNHSLALEAKQSAMEFTRTGNPQSAIEGAANAAADRVEKHLGAAIRENRVQLRRARVEAKEAKASAGVSIDKSAKVNARMRRYEERVYPYRRFE